ncbi:MSHA pilin protein MshA [Moritella sp. JT01]|uniref:type II secretion system protein n=1 Tax=Moritella sp. JT01 TaxID=756698 RepID=UPI000794FA04|nr:type II secretion system protein [Moritella sp. JT01]KXO11269.1 MSHA pilin protein MshA [Moritella sp. JT01]
MKKQNGFTLIELVIVIIVLGILAATAVPKFLNLQDDARASAMQGAEAAVHSAANIVYSKSAIDGKENGAGESVVENGDTINTEFGYPAATVTGIREAVTLDGFDIIATSPTTTPASIIFVAGLAADVNENDICLLYTQAASSSATYTLATGKLASSKTACN